MKIEARLQEKGLSLPRKPESTSPIDHAVRTGNLVYTSGNTSPRHIGKVGKDFSVEEGYQAAVDCTLGCLAAAKYAIGDLDKVTRVVKVLGLVNCAPGFFDTSSVIHGCSDLLVELFGEQGRHARSAIGVAELPANSAVEIEIIFEVNDACS
jgi:enamine deaminase RidA (YjgF/YER057c/UK114 family)